MLIGKWVLMAPHKRIGHITDLHYTKLCIITWHLLYGEDQSANITLLIRRTLRILKSSSSGRKSESSFDMKPQVSSKSMATMPRPIPIIQINKEPCGINKKQHLAFKLSQIYDTKILNSYSFKVEFGWMESNKWVEWHFLGDTENFGYSDTGCSDTGYSDNCSVF